MSVVLSSGEALSDRSASCAQGGAEFAVASWFVM